MRIGVVGTGHLGNIHINCLSQTPFNLIGINDIDSEKGIAVANNHNTTFYSDYEALLEKVDAILIVADTKSHFNLAQKAINRGVHTFIEKPVTSTLEEAFDLVKLQSKFPDLVIQVGHVERFNPAFKSSKAKIQNPRFIECHRLANFNPRGNDVSVVLDLMIHDLDILLALVNSNIKEIRANGVQVISETSDICNARIEFENGSVANITASRLSLNAMRKFRIFQDDAYISIDFLEKKNQIVKLSDNPENGMSLETKNGTKYLNIEINENQEHNAIVEEQQEFYNSIVNGDKVKVDLNHAYKVMDLAQNIEKLVQNQ